MLTKELKLRIAKTALAEMEYGCDTDFRFMSGFRSSAVNRFMAWISSLPKTQRKEAALSVTCHHLRLRHIEVKATPNFESWVGRYRDFPLNAGLDYNWRPKRYAKLVTSRVRAEFAPLRVLGPQSVELSGDNPLALPEIRTGLELNTRLADLVLFQVIRDDPQMFDVSYLSLLGVGSTEWNFSEASELDAILEQLPSVISKARELFVKE